ncbi:hypothetical protein BsWGS_12349 [Bradybaena similaris]
MASDFSNKVVIVTGSNAGLGEAMAILFASRGAKVTLCGRDQSRLKSVWGKLVKISGGHEDRFLTVAGDLNDQRIRKKIIDSTIEKFGRLDILVANAGVVSTSSSFMEESEENYDTVMNTNLKSVFFLIQLAVPHLEKTMGNIVNISSIAALMVMTNVMTYSLTKVALDHLTKCLAVDLGPKGIRVNSVNPGYFPTLILRDYKDPDEFNRQIAEAERLKQPLKGRVGVLEDVAETVAYLASDSAGFITGEIIKVDGGRTFAGPTEWTIKK